MLGAMVREIAERGVANVSVAHVVARSGVSRRTFYEIFDDREDCFLAAFDEAIERIGAAVVPVYGRPGSWQAKTRAALSTALECLDDDPNTARLLIVESLAAGPRALERRQQLLAQVVAAVELGRGEGKVDAPVLAGEGVVGGVLSVLYARLLASPSTAVGTPASPNGGGQDDSLLALEGPLMGMIVLPYLGATAARKEIARPARKRSTEWPVVRRDPLRQLEMRLTYRTVCVLTAVAANPGASNRVVADEAGIGDQGQISKLLTRLHERGLVENTGATLVRGAPNAWMLTARGREVQDAIASQTASS
jgi:AcrR family transcriptional regulator